MNLIFTPAITVLNRLKYPQKFALISLLFVVPLAVVMALLVTEIDRRIAFAQKELYGTAYLRPLRTLIELVPQANLAAGTLRGDDVVQLAEAQRLHRAIDDALVELRRVDQRYGDELGTSKQVAALAVEWHDLQRDLTLLQPAARANWYARLVEHIGQLMAQVGDSSNLILDPDLDSYYLMDAVLLKLPEQQTLLTRTLWFGVQLPLDYRVTTEEKVQMTVYRGLLQAQTAAQQDSYAVAFRSNRGDTLTSRLSAPLATHVAADAAFAEEIERHILRSQNGYPDQFVPLGTAALAANFQLWDRTVVELDRLLQLRIDGVQRQKHLIELLALSMLLLVLYLLVAFYRSVMGTVARLELAAERLVRGDMDELVALDTRDELGQVAASFNQIATALVAASAQHAAIFAHAIDAILTLDQQHAIVACNPAAEHLFGYTSAELVGQPVTLLMPDYQLTSDGPALSRREELGQRRDGGRYPLELALSQMQLGQQRLTMLIARDVSERKQIEESRAQLQQTIIQAQAEMLEALATPLIPLGEQVLVMPLIGALDQRRVQQVLHTLLRGVEVHRTRVAILDITGVPAIDTDVAQGLCDAARAVRLLGARLVLSGIQPQVAQALVALGLDLGAIVTCSSLQEGMAYALAQQPATSPPRPLVTQGG